MLVICCGMPRSGSTLQYQLAAAVVEKVGLGSGIGWVEHAHCHDLCDAGPEDKMQVLKVHSFHQLEGTREAIAEGWATCLYVYRDIRDVTVSLMNKESISFSQLVLEKRILSTLQSFYDWTSLAHTYVSRYEQMVHDLEQETMNIANHLDIALSPVDARIIASEYTIDKQKERMKNLNNKAMQYDIRKVLHANHIHSGETQQWRTCLTAVQIGYLEHVAYDWLRSQGYSLSQPFYLRWAGWALAWWYTQRQLSGPSGRLMRAVEYMRHGTILDVLIHKLRSSQMRHK